MKRTIIRALATLGIIFVVLMIYTGYLYFASSSISKGEPIPKYDHPTSALLVIDIQEGTTGNVSVTEEYINQADALILNVNELVLLADSLNIPVVYIYHQIDNWLFNLATKGVLAKNSPGTAIDNRIKIVSKNIFSKEKMDAFCNPELDEFLKQHKINKLLITGMDAVYCVNRTVYAALNRGYKITVIQDAIISETESNKIEMIEQFKSDGIHVINSNEFSSLF